MAQQVIELLDKTFQGLRQDIEVVDVTTLRTWELFMGGSGGHNNYPNQVFSIFTEMLGLNRRDSLPGLANFFFVGQCVTAVGALFMNALSGKKVIKKICRQYGVKFTNQIDPRKTEHVEVLS